MCAAAREGPQAEKNHTKNGAVLARMKFAPVSDVLREQELHAKKHLGYIS